MSALRKLLSNPLGRSRSEAPARAAEEVPGSKVVEEASRFARVGRFERALALLSPRISEHPDSAELRYARGLVLYDWGRFREALDELLVAESAGHSGFALHLNLAQVAHRLGMAELAEAHLRRCLALNPACAPAHLGLAAVLQGHKRYDEAIACFEHARELAPNDSEIVAYIATCRLAAANVQGAEHDARKAVELNGQSVRAWAALAMVLAKLDRPDEAFRAFERAESLEASSGQTPETFVTHGFNLIGFGLPDQAIELYRRYLPEQPHANAQTHCGFAQLTLGAWEQGWSNYEFRWCSDPLVNVRVAHRRPRWKGQDLRNKTLLLWTEQGIGDFIQFARFVAPLRRLGARVIVQASPAQVAFARASLEADAVIGNVSEVGDAFDFQIPMMSVPGVLRVNEASIPASVPYLEVDPVRVRAWRERIGAGAHPTVGLVWAGNAKHERDRYRSMSLRELQPVLRVDAAFMSLQKERREGDTVPEGVRWTDAAALLEDFRDTAAAVEALDLVITVDTAVAHLAGALGKPVWLMLPAAGDFRWLVEREDSPWYPTMRLFRQTSLGDWSDVVMRVHDALQRVYEAPREERRAFLLPPATSRSAALDTAPAMHALDDAGMTRVTETRYGIVQYRLGDNPAGRALEAYGQWLQPRLDWLLRVLPTDATIVEADAGFGAHTLALARHVRANGHVLAYESDPRLKRLLAQNLCANRLAGRVTIMLRRLAGTAAAAARDGAWAASGDGAAPNDIIAVETLDELDLARLHLVKLETSREAPERLRGAASTLWRCRPLLLVSVDERASIEPLTGEIKSFGYRCWRLDTPLFDAQNHDGRIEDIFGGARRTAVLAIAEEQQGVEPPADATEI